MENCAENVDTAASPAIHQFTFKKRLCVFCALSLDLLEKQEKVESDCSLNEDLFKEGVSILCETLNVTDNLNRIFSDDNWRLLGVDNFVRCICCERCYQLINELVSLQQLIVKSQNSLKKNARKLENLVVSSQEPSLEYSVNGCILLRQKILNNFSIQEQSPPELRTKPETLSKSKSPQVCPRQAVVLLQRIELSSPPIKQEINPPPVNEIQESSCPSPHRPLKAVETDDAGKDDEEYHHYHRPVKRSRRSTGRKRGRPKKVETSGVKPPRIIPSAKRGRPLLIGNQNYYLKHGDTARLKRHAIYFLSSSPPSPEGIKDHLMIYNVKFLKTSTSLHCLHPECRHQEPLTGYFTDQTLLRNMRFHIRFAHRSPPKKDKPEEDKPSFYYCHLCDSQIGSEEFFLEHQRQLHEGEEGDEVPVPPFCFCDVCGDPGVPSGDFIEHVFSHKCEHEKDVISEDLRKGVTRVGKNKDFLKPLIHPCDQCDKHFKCHTELMGHRLRHMPSEMKAKVVCEICGRGCSCAGQLEDHKRRVHWKNLPVEYECHICGQRFFKGAAREDWKVHLNSHTGEKPYQCEQCGKRFIGKRHLVNHVKVVHAPGERKKIGCEFCGKVYKEDKYLRKHCLRDHPDKVMRRRRKGVLGEEDKDKYKPLDQRDDFIGPKLMFPCEPCGKVFVFKSMLITHLKNRHKMFYERKEEYPWRLTLEEASVN